MSPSLSIQDESLRDALLGVLMQSLAPAVLPWSDEATLQADLTAMLDDQLSRRADLPAAEAFHAAIGLLSPPDYLSRVVPVGAAWVLCGIRFYGGDRDRPFVELIAWTERALDLFAAADVAMDAFAAFQPTCARVLLPEGVRLSTRDGRSVRADQVLLVARAGEMTPADRSAQVALQDAPVDEAAAFVAERYAELALRDPALAAHVPASTREQLEECAATGRLAWWMVDGARAGLIGVARGKMLGLRGYLVIEEIVAPAFRGRGTAAAAQCELASEISQADPQALIFGTIDAVNQASLRTARRAGRDAIATWWFLDRQ
jgi:hypothetical protein